MTRLLDLLQVQREGETGAGSGGGVPAVTPPAPVAPAAPPPPAPATSGDGGDRVRQLEAENASLRKEAAGYRTGNKGQLAEFAKALNALVGGDANQPADPATLLKQLQDQQTQTQKELRQSRLDNALGEIYTKHGVKPKLTRALLDSDGVLSGLDPADGEFGKTLNAAVKKLADENPEIKALSDAPKPPARSGPDLSPGGTGAPPQLSREDLAQMSSKQVADAYAKGQLNGLLKRS